MEKIKLILPQSGTTNWGNAINENFTNLLKAVQKTEHKVQSLEAQIEEDEIIDISAEYFLYLVSGKGYLNSFDNWDDASSTDTPFEPDDAANKTGYVVQVGDNSGKMVYNQVTFVTNDILYIDKNHSPIVRRLASSVGGYYVPVGTSVNPVGKIDVNYQLRPAMMVSAERDITVSSDSVISPYLRSTMFITTNSSTTTYSFTHLTYSSTYIYHVTLTNNTTFEQFYVGYKFDADNNNHLRITFNKPLPIDTLCNIEVFISSVPLIQQKIELIMNINSISQDVSLYPGQEGVLIDWGDGYSETTTSEAIENAIYHSYSNTGFYIITIQGLTTIPSGLINDNRLVSVKVWG